MSRLTEQLNLKDVHRVVQCFYDKARDDADIGHYFSTIEDFSEHEQRISCFWWLALGGKTDELEKPAPNFDMIKKHIALGITTTDLSIWLKLFKQTLNEELETTIAESWWNKAEEIARHLKALAIDRKPTGLQITEPGSENET